MKRVLWGLLLMGGMGYVSVTHDHTFLGFVTGLLALFSFFGAIGVVHVPHTHKEVQHG